MNKFFKILIILSFVLGLSELRAENLFDSLKAAYLTNPKLNAERANLRAVSEGENEALSEFKPSITISGYVSEQDNTETRGANDSHVKPSEQSLLIEQKIFKDSQVLQN